MDEVTINEETYVKKGQAQLVNTEGMPYVCVRTYSAGVHCGYLKERNGKEVELVNARRIWKWAGAFTLSELAMHGSDNPNECKIACAVDSITLTEAIEVIPMREDAARQVQEMQAYECN